VSGARYVPAIDAAAWAHDPDSQDDITILLARKR
jgi:hypothetical protein